MERSIFEKEIKPEINIDAQNEVIGVCVRKGGMERGINATSRFPMYNVMKFPQALV